MEEKEYCVKEIIGKVIYTVQAFPSDFAQQTVSEKVKDMIEEEALSKRFSQGEDDESTKKNPTG